VAGEGVKGKEAAVYLITMASGRMRVLKGHTAAVHALTFSPDGKMLASGSEDHTIRVWEVASGRVLRLLGGHKAGILSLAFSPDSRSLLSVAVGNQARVWVVTTDQSVLLQTVGGSRCRAWSPDEKTIAIATVKGAIRLWNANGTFLKKLDFGALQTHSLTFAGDSRSMLMAGGRCAILDLDGKVKVEFTSHTPRLTSRVTGTLSHDGKHAVTAGQGDEVFLWRTADAKIARHLGGQGRTGWSVAWSPDGQTVAWGNVRRHSPKKDLPGVLERTCSLAELELARPTDETYRRQQWALDGLSVERGTVGSVVVKRGATTVSTMRLPPRIDCFTLLPGKKLAVGGAQLVLFDTRNGQRLRTFGGASDVHAIAPSPDNRYLLTASDSQALTFWDPNREEALLSLFVTGEEWIAWTPEGYYASSPGGEKLIGWHVNNGLDRLGSVHPAARFRNSLYRPDVIKLLLKHGSVVQALEAADKARKQETRFFQVADVVPPVIVVTAPEHIEQPNVEVRAVVQAIGKHPITALRLLLDGRPYGGPKGLKTLPQRGLDRVDEKFDITLTPGKHRLAVLAETAVSKGSSETVPVTFERARGIKPIPITPEQELAERPALYVLAVGISKYPGDLKLDCAAKDAEVLAKTLNQTTKDLYREVKAELLLDKQASRGNILEKLTELGKRMTQRDVAIVSFAGHGDQDNRGRFFLLPVDGKPDHLLSTCVDGGQVKSVLSDMPGKVVVLLDACHSGAVAGPRNRAGGALTKDLIRDLVSDDCGVIVMCSSQGREFSLEDAKKGHGFFTLALIEGLRGKAANKAGVVYMHQLQAWVIDRVRELSGGRQHPYTPENIRSFPLARPPS
jgi:WD40 repeat protein